PYTMLFRSDAVAAAQHVFAYSKRFGELDYVGTNIFDLLTVFCFDSDEPIGNKSAEIKRNLCSIAVSHWHRRPVLPRPVYFPRLLESCEQLSRCRNADRIGFDRFCK